MFNEFLFILTLIIPIMMQKVMKVYFSFEKQLYIFLDKRVEKENTWWMLLIEEDMLSETKR